MDEHALTIKTIRDGPVCVLALTGDLDFFETGRFLEQAVLAVDNRTERLVLDLAGVTFLDCAGIRALATAASFASSGCPVIIRSLSPMARRILELLDLDIENIRQVSSARELQDRPELRQQSAGSQPERDHLRADGRLAPADGPAPSRSA